MRLAVTTHLLIPETLEPTQALPSSWLTAMTHWVQQGVWTSTRSSPASSPFAFPSPFFFFFFPCPAPFHSSPLFPWLIHAFPGAFYHCHCFPRSPLIRGAVTRVSVGGWQMVAAAGPGQGSSITAGPALEGLSRSKVIVGGEEAFFTADEEERCGVVLMPW